MLQVKINFQVHTCNCDLRTVTALLGAGAEDGGADADFCGAFLDGDFEVVGHAHGEDGERQGG